MIWSLDTESYYDKEFSITTMGAWGYVFHPEAEHYLISVVGSDGTRYVGPPEDAPWRRMEGGIWLSWNAAYDCLVIQRLQKDGRVPSFDPADWHDPAHLVAYMGYPRSLKMAIKSLYDVDVSKGTRDQMKGKRWRDMSPDFREEVQGYALTDAEWPLKVWTDYADRWPEKERRLSRITREMGWRGIRIDVPRVKQGIELMENLCYAAKQKIPWDGPKLSYPKLCEQCKKESIEAPLSLAKDSEESDAWEDKYGVRFPWVGAMRINRRCNALLKKLKTILSRVREDGTAPTELKYCGAYPTARWSGSGGINWQNLSREEQFGQEWWKAEGEAVIGDLVPPVTEGVYLRGCLIPREGNQFLVPDLSAIEPRCAAVIVKDQAFLNLLAQGHSPYDAHAVSTGMSKPHPVSLAERDVPLYTLAKARELALGYASGHHKFIVMAPMYVSAETCERIFSAAVTDGQVKAYESYLVNANQPAWTKRWKEAEDKGKLALVNSWLIVEDYRAKKPKTVGMWKRLQGALEAAVGEDLAITLPSGRVMTYRKVAKGREDEDTDQITALMPKFGRMAPEKLYGGKIFAHVVSGTARDVFADAWLRVDDAGYAVVLSIHDELIIDAPMSASSEDVKRIMSQPVEWMPTLPVAAKCSAMERYTK